MKLQGRKVIVTGGAGFIGSELCRQLAEAGANVTAVDNLVNGKRENLADVGGVCLEAADIRDTDKMHQLFKGAAIVYHLACLGVRHSLHSPMENHDVNAGATLALLKLSRDLEVGRFVNVSSSEVYGTARWAPMDERHPTFPMTVYGSSKLAGECYTRAYFESYGYPTVVVRPFNAFGPRCHHEGDSGEVIPKFMLRGMAGKSMMIFGDGTQTRDFTFVADSARGILLAGIAEAALGKTLNLGSGKEITVNELAVTVAQVIGKNFQIIHDAPRPGDVLRLCADSSLAQKLLDYTPRYSLKEGLEKLHHWYLSLDKSVDELLKEEIVHNWAVNNA